MGFRLVYTKNGVVIFMAFYDYIKNKIKRRLLPT